MSCIVFIIPINCICVFKVFIIGFIRIFIKILQHIQNYYFEILFLFFIIITWIRVYCNKVTRFRLCYNVIIINVYSIFFFANVQASGVMIKEVVLGVDVLCCLSQVDVPFFVFVALSGSQESVMTVVSWQRVHLQRAKEMCWDKDWEGVSERPKVVLSTLNGGVPGSCRYG